jgi:peptide/nickel transport system permease protein
MKMKLMFKGQKTSIKLALFILCSSMIMGIFNQLICNEKPIISKIEGNWKFPAVQEFGNDLGLTSQNQSINQDYSNATVHLYPPIRYSFDFIDTENGSLLPPFSQGINGTHLLGTDRLGRDVFAGILRGFYIALKVGFISVLFAALLGLFMGMTMGYFQDNGIKLNFLQLFMLAIGILLLTFYGFYGQGFATKSISSIFISLFMLLSLYSSDKLKLPKYSIPFDFILLKIIEVFKSIPTLVILLAVLPLFQTRSVANIILIIVLLGWKSFARYARAETLAIKNESFVLNAKSQGQKDFQILIRQLLPNILPTILVIASFSVASVIVLESTLSFLGIGLPIEEVSWGSLMAQGRNNVSSWWLTLFPGLCIFIVVLCINELTDRTIKIDE